MTPEEPRRIFAGNQPTFLPWLGQFEQMAFCDVYVIADDFQLSIPSWQNRNKIKGRPGAVWLQVPVERAFGQPINEARIAYRRNWPRKHLQAIRQYYSKAPFFHDHWSAIEEIYNRRPVYLVEFTMALLAHFVRALGVEVDFLLTSELRPEGRKAERVIDLCRRVECNTAYLAAGTRAYVDEAKFREQGIEIIYQDYAYPIYPQTGSDFIPFLGVLDLLMNCGPDSLAILLSTSRVMKGPVVDAQA